MSFLYSVEEDKKDKHKFIMITGFEESVADLIIPEEISGLRVEAVGNHSFSARSDLRSVTIPGSVRTLYGFAFHNCRNLKKISLCDSIDDYYDGVCRQCDSLDEIEITMNRGWFEVIRNFLADSDRTLRFVIKEKADKADESGCLDNGKSSAAVRITTLTFPEYVYDFNENTMARTIQFSIAGSGMFYRECVDRRSINYREYDRLFEKARIDGGLIAEAIALGRLLFATELEDGFRAQYEEYVGENAESILTRLVTTAAENEDSKEQLVRLLDYNEERPVIPGKAIDASIALSAEKKYTEISAILMKYARGSDVNEGLVFEFKDQHPEFVEKLSNLSRIKDNINAGLKNDNHIIVAGNGQFEVQRDNERA
jgi:hypothetical protein